MRATVVVVGGGYGGIAVAKTLDDVVDVVLVEPRDTFVHNVAALRGLVEPAWVDRLFLPYDRLLTRGRVVHERAVRVDRAGVTLGSGDRLAADYVVLATGSAYPFPAKFGIDDDSDAIITALPEAKMAKAAGLHADVVARNIRTLLEGRGDLVAYEPAAPGILLPLGPRGGASYTPETGILGADATARLKGADLRTGSYAKLLGRRPSWAGVHV